MAATIPASSQESFAGCTAEALARSVPIRADGTFLLDNVPAGGRVVRVSITCTGEDGLRRGFSGFVEILTNGLVDVGQIALQAAAPGVGSLSISAAKDRLEAPTETSQLTVIANRSDGSSADVTAGETGTTYTTSNPLVAHVDQDGLITAAVRSGTAVIGVVHGGIVATKTVTVALGSDSDNDGLPDELERTFACLDPNVADAGMDPDSDARTSLQEFQSGTDPCVADTDGDGLRDGQEAVIGSNPVLPDSDLDGLLDGQEPNPIGNGDGDGLINVLDPDQDNDGLPDGIEVRICGSPTCANPTADNDGDGLSNVDEVGLGTDPAQADTDGDGLTDSAEVLGGTDPINPDMDGDGFPDGFETAAGSNPRDPNSIPVIPSATEAVGKPFSVLSTASPAPPASLEAVGRIFSVLNRANPAPPTFAEADGKLFSLLNQAPPAPPASAEADSKVFSLLNTALPPAPGSAEAIGKIFSLLNEAAPAPPASVEAVGPLVSLENTTPP